MTQKNHVELDFIDAVILKKLLKEARTSFTEIAQECKITPAGVRAKFLRLKKLGVINGAIMQVNPYNLGYDCICDITMNTDSEKKAKEYLQSRSYAGSTYRRMGKQNLAIGVILRSINDLQSILQDLAKSESIKNVQPLIWAKTTNMDHPENLVIEPLIHNKETRDRFKPEIINGQKIELDERDIEIARILIDNARVSFSQIAKKINIPLQTVIRKYDRMRNNVLSISTITINLQKLGYKAIARISLKISNKSEEERIHSTILEMENVIVTVNQIGIYDLGLLVVLKDFDDWFKIQEKIKQIDGVSQFDFSFDKAFEKWPKNLFRQILTTEKPKQDTLFRKIRL